MAQDQVGAGVGAQRRQVGEVALHGHDAVLQAALGRPPGQRRQRVGAGVEHGDPVPGLGQRDGEAAGAPARVDDVEAGATRVGLGEDRRQHLPDDGGAG